QRRGFGGRTLGNMQPGPHEEIVLFASVPAGACSRGIRGYLAGPDSCGSQVASQNMQVCGGGPGTPPPGGVLQSRRTENRLLEREMSTNVVSACSHHVRAHTP